MRWHPEEQYKLLVGAACGTVTFYNTETRAAVSALHTGVPGLAGADWSPMDSLRVATVHDSRLVTMDVSRLRLVVMGTPSVSQTSPVDVNIEYSVGSDHWRIQGGGGKGPCPPKAPRLSFATPPKKKRQTKVTPDA